MTLMADFLLKCLKVAGYFGTRDTTDLKFAGITSPRQCSRHFILYQPERLSVRVEACGPHKKETDSESFSLFGRVPVAFEKRQISQLEGK